MWCCVVRSGGVVRCGGVVEWCGAVWCECVLRVVSELRRGVARCVRTRALLHRERCLQRVIELLHHRVAHEQQRAVGKQSGNFRQVRLRQTLRMHVDLPQPCLRRPASPNPSRTGVAILGDDILQLPRNAIPSHPARCPVDARLEGELRPAGLVESEPSGALEAEAWRGHGCRGGWAGCGLRGDEGGLCRSGVMLNVGRTAQRVVCKPQPEQSREAQELGAGSHPCEVGEGGWAWGGGRER